MDSWVLFSDRRDLLDLWDKIARKYVIGVTSRVPSQNSKLVYYQDGILKAVFSGEWTEKEVVEFCLQQIQEKKESSFQDYLYTFSDDV